MIDMERPWEGAKARDRDWFKKVAADAVIKSLWSAAEKIGGSEERYLKLLILTGKRKTALANMRWEEIDNDWFWDPPPSDTKNKRLHGVPLSSLAQRILHPRQPNGSVFGALNFDKLQRKVCKESGVSDFFYHGVRHLVETKTAELRDGNGRSLILPHIRDMLLDHAMQRGSGKDYDHHDYKPEMRAAAEAWANYIEKLIQPRGAALLR